MLKVPRVYLYVYQFKLGIGEYRRVNSDKGSKLELVCIILLVSSVAVQLGN